VEQSVRDETGISESDARSLDALFDRFGREVDARTPAAKAADGRSRVGQLKEAITGERPNGGRIAALTRWFAEASPGLGRAFAEVMSDPLVRKVLAAGARDLAGAVEAGLDR